MVDVWRSKLSKAGDFAFHSKDTRLILESTFSLPLNQNYTGQKA